MLRGNTSQLAYRHNMIVRSKVGKVIPSPTDGFGQLIMLMLILFQQFRSHDRSHHTVV